MFSSFIKPVISLATKHPGVAFAAAGFSIAAPGFLRDENRGYFRTALVTTPVIWAMSAAGPGLVSSASRSMKGGLQFVREMPFSFSKNPATTYRDIRNYMESGFINLGAGGNPAFRNWVDDAAVDFFSQVDRGAPPIEESMKNAMTIFDTLIKDDQRRGMLTYAVEGARLRAFSPAQLAGENIPNFLAPMVESSLRETINANRSNPRFVEEFSKGLGWAERLRDTGTFYPPVGTPQTLATTKLSMEEGISRLQAQRPKVAEYLQSAVTKGYAGDVTLVAEEVVSGQIGNILGIHLKKGKQELSIPIFDPATGTVHGGEGFTNLGAARKLYDPTSIDDIDIFTTSRLGRDWKTLDKDISRASVFGGVDNLSVWKFQEGVPIEDRIFRESQMATLSPHARLLHSYGAIPTSDPVFGMGGNTAFEDLQHDQRVSLLQYMRDKWNVTRVGSESGTGKGKVELQALDFLHAGGMPSLAKQTSLYRSFAKDIQLANVPVGMQSYYRSSAWKPTLGLDALPEVRATVATVDPQIKSLFGDLPGNVNQLPDYIPTAIKRIAADTGKTEEEALSIWKKLMPQLVEPGYLESAKKLGWLGEGGVLLHDKYSSLSMERKANISVSQLHLDPQAYKDMPFGAQDLIGFDSSLKPVTSTAPQNYIESVAGKEGDYILNLRQVYPIETGTKVDVGGKKGLGIKSEVYYDAYGKGNDFERIRQLLNLYGEASGTGTAIPSYADIIAPSHYFEGGKGDPVRAMYETAAAVIDRSIGSFTSTTMSDAYTKAMFESSKEDVLREINQYMFDMSAQGIHFINDIHTHNLQILEDMDYVKTVDKGDRVLAVANRTNQFFERMGNLAKQNRFGTRGELFDAFRKSGMSDLGAFMQKNALSTTLAAWDTTRNAVPQITTTTFDLFSEMYRMGHKEGIKDLLGRIQFQGGDPSKAADFANNFMQGLRDNKFTSPLNKSIGITEAVPGPAGVNLSSLETRANSIFDPVRADIQDNFSLALKEPVVVRYGGREMEVSHIPVLGKGAYGGGTNKYGIGEFSATPLEHKLADIVRNAHNPVGLSKLIPDYFDELQSTLFGKEGFYRAKGADIQKGVTGFLQTRAQVNPFEMVISEQMAGRIRDDSIRESLLAGESRMAVVSRHPIQSTPYMKVRVDKDAGLGINMLGMDERARSIFGADDDKDALNLHLMDKGSAAEQEAMRSIDVLDSSQWRSLRFNEMGYGSVDNSRNIVKSGVSSFLDLIAKLPKTEAERTAQVEARLAGTTIGKYSNLLTRLQQNIEMHPTIGHNAEAREILSTLFWPIRQVPISAQKGQMGFGKNPLSILEKLSVGLTARDPEKFINGLKDTMSAFNKPSVLDETTAKMYTDYTGIEAKPGQVIENAVRDLLGSEKVKNILSDFVTNRNVQADRAAQLITGASDTIGKRSEFLFGEIGEGAFPYLKGMTRESRSGKYISKVLGTINELIKSGGKAAGESIKPNTGILALGLGLVATAGVLGTRLKPSERAGAAFSRGMVDSARPDEATTVSDQVPGEPMAGQMSSVNPPWRQLSARKGVDTAVVAPMYNRNDLEVRMKAQDRRDTAEVQRIVSQVSGSRGVSNVNVNYQNGWRNKTSRLRQRQIIKDQLDES